MIVVVLDFETMAYVDLKKAGAWRYAEEPTTDVICAGYTVDGQEISVDAGVPRSLARPIGRGPQRDLRRAQRGLRESDLAEDHGAALRVPRHPQLALA